MLQGLCWFQEVFNQQRVCFQGALGEIFPKSVPDFNICAHSLSYSDIKLSLPYRAKKIKEFSRNFEAILLFKGFSCALEI